MTVESNTKTYADFILPPSVVSKVDLSRLIREIEWVDGELTSASVRAKTGSQTPAAPVLSATLAEFLTQNDIKLDDSLERTTLIKQMRLLKDKVPVLHMTFAVSADPESLQQLSAWVRESIHPQAVISVGLQPGLVAGVYLRTPNHVHDFSVRSKLQSSRGLLVKELESLTRQTPAVEQDTVTIPSASQVAEGAV